MSLIVPDVNVLVYAFRADSAEHLAYAGWLNRALREDTVGIADTILSGFVRIVTHPRIMSDPAPVARAIEFTQRLAEYAFWLTQGERAWNRLSTLSGEDHGIRGNLVPDAHIAALCLENRATLATRDRGFARFPGLRWFDPGS